MECKIDGWIDRYILPPNGGKAALFIIATVEVESDVDTCNDVYTEQKQRNPHVSACSTAVQSRWNSRISTKYVLFEG
jgi:hypothetical protein